MDPIAILALLSDLQQEIVHLRTENTKLAKAAEDVDAMREHIAKLEASDPLPMRCSWYTTGNAPGGPGTRHIRPVFFPSMQAALQNQGPSARATHETSA